MSGREKIDMCTFSFKFQSDNVHAHIIETKDPTGPTRLPFNPFDSKSTIIFLCLILFTKNWLYPFFIAHKKETKSNPHNPSFFDFSSTYRSNASGRRYILFLKPPKAPQTTCKGSHRVVYKVKQSILPPHSSVPSSSPIAIDSKVQTPLYSILHKFPFLETYKMKIPHRSIICWTFWLIGGLLWTWEWSKKFKHVAYF